jgi:hypothetical protein
MSTEAVPPRWDWPGLRSTAGKISGYLTRREAPTEAETVRITASCLCAAFRQ